VERGADVNTRDKDHQTPLHLASHKQHIKSVQVLLICGANVNAKDKWGRTPLHRVFATQEYPRVSVIPQLLLKYGADVNARDEVYETPLHLASRLGSFEGAWILLKHGADMNVENTEGKIPFQLAQESIKEKMRRESPKFFGRSHRRFRNLKKRPTIVEGIVLMGLLYGY